MEGRRIVSEMPANGRLQVEIPTASDERSIHNGGGFPRLVRLCPHPDHGRRRQHQRCQPCHHHRGHRQRTPRRLKWTKQAHRPIPCHKHCHGVSQQPVCCPLRLQAALRLVLIYLHPAEESIAHCPLKDLPALLFL